MGCIQSSRAHLNEQTEAIISKYQLQGPIVVEAYSWFTKLCSKADFNRTPVQIRNHPTTSIKFHDVRASLAVPYSVLSDHMLDLLIDEIDEHETLTFPMFLELMCVLSLASHDHLMEFAFFSFAVDHEGNLSLDNLTVGLTDVAAAYPQLVNGRPLAVNSFVAVARNFLLEGSKQAHNASIFQSNQTTRHRAASSPHPSSRPTSPPSTQRSNRVHSLAPSASQLAEESSNDPKFTFAAFNLFFRRHGWLLDTLRVLQLAIHRKLGGSRDLHRQRSESLADQTINELIEQRMRRQRDSKKKRPSIIKRRPSMHHNRRASTVHSAALASLGRHHSHHGITDHHGGRDSPTADDGSVHRVDSMSRLPSPRESPHQSVPHSILKRPHQHKKSPRRSVSHSNSFAASSPYREVGHPHRQASLSLPGAISSTTERHHGLSEYSSTESVHEPTHSRLVSTASIAPPHHSPAPSGHGFRPSLKTRISSKESHDSTVTSPQTRSPPEVVLATDSGGHEVCEIPAKRPAHHGHAIRVKRFSLQNHNGTNLSSHAEVPRKMSRTGPVLDSHPMAVPEASTVSFPSSQSFSPASHHHMQMDGRIISPPPRRVIHHNHHVSRSNTDSRSYNESEIHVSLRAVGASSLSHTPNSPTPSSSNNHKKAPSESHLRHSLIGSDSASSMQEEQLVRLLQTPLPASAPIQLAPLTSAPRVSLNVPQRDSTSSSGSLNGLHRPRSSSTSVAALSPATLGRPVIAGRACSSSVMGTTSIIAGKA